MDCFLIKDWGRERMKVTVHSKLQSTNWISLNPPSRPPYAIGLVRPSIHSMDILLSFKL